MSSVSLAYPHYAINKAERYYKRKNKELAKLASLSFNIDKRHYATHQIQDPFVLTNGKKVSKPPKW